MPNVIRPLSKCATVCKSWALHAEVNLSKLTPSLIIIPCPSYHSGTALNLIADKLHYFQLLTAISIGIKWRSDDIYHDRIVKVLVSRATNVVKPPITLML